MMTKRVDLSDELLASLEEGVEILARSGGPHAAVDHRQGVGGGRSGASGSVMQDPKFTPAGGAKFYYLVRPDGRDGFNMAWWLRATDGAETTLELEPAVSEQDAEQKAHKTAERYGFTHALRAP